MQKITLANLNNASEQEIFNQVAKHLLTQNKKSIKEDGVCLYKSPEGLKCAAGCLISNEEYRPEFETNSWYWLIRDSKFPKEHQALIRDLQFIHDQISVSDWKRYLEHAAGTYSLNTEVLDEVS